MKPVHPTSTWALATAVWVAMVHVAAAAGFQGKPLAAGVARASGARFQSMPPAQTGVDFVYQWNRQPRYERLLNSSAVGGGVAAGDFDGDGRPDLCFTRPAGGMRLYRNLGDWRFEDVTEKAGVREDGWWTTGVTFADVNNDGRLDLYVCCYEAPNRLYINQGNGRFKEEAAAWGVDFQGASMMMAFADFDHDGKLDAYLLTGGLMPGPAQKFRVNFVNRRPVVPEELQEYWQIFYLPGDRAATAEAGQRDHLFHQNASGRFTEVSAIAGVQGCDFGNAAIWWDYNGDGWPDLYVANDYFGPDRLYRNNRDGTFTDVAREVLPSTPWTSMGADIADFNNDGLLDLIASDMAGTTRFKRLVDSGDMERSGWFLDWAEPRQHMRNALFANTGAGRFLEVAQWAGVAHTDWTWSIVCGDLDGDGREDIFVPNGMTRDWMDNDLAMQSKQLPPSEYGAFWQRQPVRRDRNLAFRNVGEWRFQESARAWGLDHEGPSFGAVLVDLDGDGRLDVVVNDFEAPARIYRNEQAGDNRVVVRLQGKISNRFGVGATVQVETEAGRQTRYVTLARGFMSAGEPAAQFGLGTATKIRHLHVRWPSGVEQDLPDLDGNQVYELTEPSDATPADAQAQPAPTWFVPTQRLAGARADVSVADDFQAQPLLPWKVTELGPALAWGDVDGDGVPEFYLGGGNHQQGAIYRRGADGNYQRREMSGGGAWEDEIAAAFLDANADGKLDLVVLQAKAGAVIYFNQAQGGWQRAPTNGLPSLVDSCGSMAAGDFDHDGDMDLFLGGRWQPGGYPLGGASHLWRNDRGIFRDVTAGLAPGLRPAGRVSEAVWADVDNDGWPDLILATTWGPVRLFRNVRGHLTEQTEEAGLSKRLGWWTSVVAGDVNGDGRVDLVVGNWGANTRYQPSLEQPCLLFSGNFGGAESQLVEAIGTAQGIFPLRGKSALEKVVPSIAERYPTHRAYASAALPDLVGKDELNRAVRFEVNTVESGVWLNMGEGKFAFRSLPCLAQVAPVGGLAMADFNGDGTLDLFVAQNFSRAQRESGRMNGGVGALLQGRGDGTFDSVWPDRSGVVVPEDGVRAAAVDFTGDGRADLVVVTRDGQVRAFENRASPLPPR